MRTRVRPMVRVREDQLALLVLGAVRYGMGRMTYIVGATCETVREVWPLIPAGTRGTLLRDVHERLVEVAREGRLLGMQMDHDEWAALADWMLVHQTDPVRTR